MTWRFHAVFGLAASVAVAFAVVWGFMIVGSPNLRRLERFDQQRLYDLQAIVREIEGLVVDADQSSRSLKRPLPETLEELAERARAQRIKLHDPETGEPYRYIVKNETTFELCATFNKDRNADVSVYWNHPAGAHCFTIDVLDPPPFY